MGKVPAKVQEHEGPQRKGGNHPTVLKDCTVRYRADAVQKDRTVRYRVNAVQKDRTVHYRVDAVQKDHTVHYRADAVEKDHTVVPVCTEAYCASCYCMQPFPFFPAVGCMCSLTPFLPGTCPSGRTYTSIPTK